MAGLGGLAAIGAGLGQWAKNYQEQQNNLRQQQMLALTLQRYQQEQQDRKDQNQRDSAKWDIPDLGGGSPVGGGGLGGMSGFPGGMPTPASPQPMSGRDLGGGLRAGGTRRGTHPMCQHIKQKGKLSGNYNIGYGGTDLSSAPLDEYGFPIWAGKMGPAGMSHAAGAYQFQPATWRAYAGPLGIKDFSPASQDAVYKAAHAAEGDRPWAASAPRGGGGQQLASAAPRSMTDAGPGGGGDRTGWSSPPGDYGSEAANAAIGGGAPQPAPPARGAEGAQYQPGPVQTDS